MPTIPRKQTPNPAAKKGARDTAQDRRYWSGAWRKARLAYLKRHPVCNDCGNFANVVDHVTPVRQGGEFWSSDNWQPLCTHCHAVKSGKEAWG